MFDFKHMKENIVKEMTSHSIRLRGGTLPVKPENLRGALTDGSVGGAISWPLVFSLVWTFFFGLALTFTIRSAKQDKQLENKTGTTRVTSRPIIQTPLIGSSAQENQNSVMKVFHPQIH